MVTAVPTGPEVGDRLEIVGATVTVKTGPVLVTPPTVTITLPVVAPLGTPTVMLLAHREHWRVILFAQATQCCSGTRAPSSR
jgi:hypothetical protein